MKLTRPAEVGAIVREYRRARQMRQAELAQRLGVSAKWLSQFENGKATAQIGLVIRVLHELGFELRVEPAASITKRTQHHAPKAAAQRFSINDVVDD
ncbi:MAG: helix-turn-helix domain-containing protein [Hyphomonadaceae bacterium]